MSALHKVLDARRARPDDRPVRTSAPEPQIMRVVSPTPEPEPPAMNSAAPQDWEALLLRIHSAAKQSRGLEAQARERETRITAVLERFHKDIDAANERARSTETRARETLSRAEAQVIAAEERARAAEDRARCAEEWLARVQDAITTEFSGLMGGA